MIGRKLFCQRSWERWNLRDRCLAGVSNFGCWDLWLFIKRENKQQDLVSGKFYFSPFRESRCLFTYRKGSFLNIRIRIDLALLSSTSSWFTFVMRNGHTEQNGSKSKCYILKYNWYFIMNHGIQLVLLGVNKKQARFNMTLKQGIIPFSPSVPSPQRDSLAMYKIINNQRLYVLYEK